MVSKTTIEEVFLKTNIRNAKKLKAKDKKIEELEDKLKQNQFEVIASGEAAKDLFLKGLYFMNDINTNNKFKKYDDKNIQIGVREVK